MQTDNFIYLPWEGKRKWISAVSRKEERGPWLPVLSIFILFSTADKQFNGVMEISWFNSYHVLAFVSQEFARILAFASSILVELSSACSPASEHKKLEKIEGERGREKGKKMRIIILPQSRKSLPFVLLRSLPRAARAQAINIVTAFSQPSTPSPPSSLSPLFLSKIHK